MEILGFNICRVVAAQRVCFEGFSKDHSWVGKLKLLNTFRTMARTTILPALGLAPLKLMGLVSLQCCELSDSQYGARGVCSSRVLQGGQGRCP